MPAVSRLVYITQYLFGAWAVLLLETSLETQSGLVGSVRGIRVELTDWNGTAAQAF